MDVLEIITMYKLRNKKDTVSRQKMSNPFCRLLPLQEREHISGEG